ncbi:hypothetical protein ZTR_06280 [Talaromyces verruculosus]|nr:hypothetical protein ZTR_06280 [Talaromyces verruculosus]
MGGMNYQIEIQFEDGISWLARIRRVNATSSPADLRAYIMHSEVATLQFLSSKTKVPVAEVYDYNLDEKNPIGVEYSLMEKLAGQSLRWSLLSSAPEQRKKVMTQLADTYIELQRFSFNLMGSFDRPGTEHDPRMLPMGPFTSSEEYFIASIQLTVDLIMREECFTPQAIDAYLIHRFLLDSVPKDILSHRDDGRFYLRHADNKGDHIFLDDDYDITGILDWEWAHTDTKSAAFNSPVMLLPVAEFYDGTINWVRMSWFLPSYYRTKEMQTLRKS